MAQTRVSEFFPSKKKTRHSNATKRRRVEITTTEEDISSLKNSHNIQSQVQQETDVEPTTTSKQRSRTKSVNLTVTAKGKTKGAQAKPKRQSTRRKGDVLEESQPKISDVFSPNVNEYKNATSGLSFDFSETTEAVGSAYDEHDGPEGTPTKQLRLTSRTAERKSKKEIQSTEHDSETPQRELETEQATVPVPRSARKKLQMNTEQNKSTIPDTIDKIMTSMKMPDKVISPMPVTPETMKTPTKSKGPTVPTSPNVKAAIEKCKKLLNTSTGDPKGKEKQIKEEIRARLKKCGKLEELKAHLSEMNKAKKQLKAPAPKLKKFDNIEIEIKTPPPSPGKSPKKCEPKVPAYEKYHSLATPPPPTLGLPYKYKLLMEMFRGMDTVVSMMHNRCEICTFSKLKVAVQTMTKRNFEKKNVAQIRTVYPSAYTMRQERVPMYGKKMSDYQLSVEANLVHKQATNTSVKGRISFTASHLLERKHMFHAGLVSIVKQYHQEFLSSLDNPLRIPDDKITRWHPQFPLDECPEVIPAALPEAPNIHKYQSARDVLEHTRGKLVPKVEQALESVAKNTVVKTEIKQENMAGPSDNPSVKGVPMSLLEKIRAKEAKKLEAALTRNPAEDRKKAMISRLPDMIRIIRAYFVTEKKPSIPVDTMVQKLADSYKSAIAIADVESHVKLLLELAPEWLTMVQIKKGRYLKIDRNIDTQALSGKIQNQAKSQ